MLPSIRLFAAVHQITSQLFVLFYRLRWQFCYHKIFRCHFKIYFFNRLTYKINDYSLGILYNLFEKSNVTYSCIKFCSWFQTKMKINTKWTSFGLFESVTTDQSTLMTLYKITLLTKRKPTNQSASYKSDLIIQNQRHFFNVGENTRVLT